MISPNKTLATPTLIKSSYFPFYVFILPATFVLHVINEYYGLVPSPLILKFFFYYELLALILFGIGYVLYRSIRKAGIWTIMLLVIFFLFGSLHDSLKKITSLPVIARYSFVMPVLFVACMIASVHIHRSKKSFGNLHRYLTLLFILFPLFEIGLLLHKQITRAEKRNNFAYNNTENIKLNNCDSCQKPDIFLIVFDEYASSAALKKYWEFDNSDIDSAFDKNHFFVAKNSKSNYNSSPLSIGACFNSQYFNVDIEQDSSTGKILLQSWHSLKMSILPNILASHQYRILNFGLNDLQNYPALTGGNLSEYQSKSLYLETLWGRIIQDIWWNIEGYNIEFLRNKAVKENERMMNSHLALNKLNYDKFLEELSIQDLHPKFVFSHLLLPHGPFYLDRNGSLIKNARYIGFDYDENKYLEQVRYTNKLIKSIIEVSNKPFSRPRIVIVMGDHGFRIPGNPRESHFMNLNAFYFSDHNYSSLYDKISPVNTFRIIFNQYFYTALPLLPDSTIYQK